MNSLLGTVDKLLREENKLISRRYITPYISGMEQPNVNFFFLSLSIWRDKQIHSTYCTIPFMSSGVIKFNRVSYIVVGGVGVGRNILYTAEFKRRS